MSSFIVKTRHYIDEKIVQPFKQNLANPNFLARSVSIGTFCSLIPSLGQAYYCFIFWILFKKVKFLKFSLIIAVAMTAMTNPLTMPFFLYGYYMVGSFFLKENRLSLGDFIDKLKDILDSHKLSFWESLERAFTFILDDFGKAIAIGCAVFIIILCPLFYWITYELAKYLNSRKSSKK